MKPPRTREQLVADAGSTIRDIVRETERENGGPYDLAFLTSAAVGGVQAFLRSQQWGVESTFTTHDALRLAAVLTQLVVGMEEAVQARDAGVS